MPGTRKAHVRPEIQPLQRDSARSSDPLRDALPKFDSRRLHPCLGPLSRVLKFARLEGIDTIAPL